MKETLKFIGHTPLYHVEDTNIYVKLEKYNAGGSIKDRAVLGMLLKAMEKGIVKDDSVLVEATSGNTGIALAMLGAIYKLNVVIIMPETMSVERRKLIQTYGAKLVLTDGKKGMQGSIDEMQALKEKYPNYVSLSQFDNPDNPNYHYETTGQEILDQLPNVDVFVAGVGTGGTFSGVARRLKDENEAIYCVAAEPASSPMISEGQAGPHKIQGIGANFVPKNFDARVADEIMTITNEEAIEETKNFARTTGILVGISSGGNIAAAKRLAARYPDKNIVTIAPDGGEKYLSVLEFDE